MLIPKFVLTILVLELGNSPFLAGRTSIQNKKTFLSQNAAIRKQLISQTDQITGRNQRGRKRLELLTSLEEDAIPVPVSDNQAYILLKDTVNMLEKIAIAARNGDTKSVKLYRKTAKQVKKAQQAMLSAIGAKTIRKARNIAKTITPHSDDE